MEVPIPSLKIGQVLITMGATRVNVVDWKSHNGISRPFMPRMFLFISGSGLAGEVVALKVALAARRGGCGGPAGEISNGCCGPAGAMADGCCRCGGRCGAASALAVQ